MSRDDVIQAITELLAEMKTYGVPYMMTDLRMRWFLR